MATAMQTFTNEDFGEVRIIMRDGEPWFVAADVCRILDLSNPTVALERLDEDERAKFNLGRQGEANIINEAGLYRLIFASRKSEAKQFQRWIYHEVLPSIRKTGSYSMIANKAPMSTAAIIADIEEASEKLQTLFAVKRGIALSCAIDVSEKLYGLNLTAFKEILPPAQHETGFMNPTQIGEKLGGIKPRIVNMLLAEAGLQYKADKNWRLTEAGRAFGEEMPYTRNGHTGWQIRWNGDVLYELEKREESFGQEALSSRVFKEAIIHV